MDKTKPNGQNWCRFVGRIVKLKFQMKTSLTNVYGCQIQKFNCRIYFTFPVIIKKNTVHYKEEFIYRREMALKLLLAKVSDRLALKQRKYAFNHITLPVINHVTNVGIDTGNFTDHFCSYSFLNYPPVTIWVVVTAQAVDLIKE